jgi:hypothetical protein
LRIRLTRKLANSLNGLDLSRVSVGDVIDLPDRVAMMLIREGWAERIADLGATQPESARPGEHADA